MRVFYVCAGVLSLKVRHPFEFLTAENRESVLYCTEFSPYFDCFPEVLYLKVLLSRAVVVVVVVK